MSTESDNFEPLRNAGIIRTDDLPEQHRKVIDELDDSEVKVLLDVWERLQAADRDAGDEVAAGEQPKWITYMFF